MSDELNQNELKTILRDLGKQLERIAESLEKLADIAHSDRKESRKPFPTSHMRDQS